MYGLIAALALHGSAAGFIATNFYQTAAEQTVAGEQWVLADAAELKGRHLNDLFIACGGPLAFDGTYAGNIWGATGGDAVVRGIAERNVRLTGRTVRIDGPVGGSLTALADTVILTTNSVVRGDLRLTGTRVIVEGTVLGEAHITASRLVSLGGSVGGDVRILAPEILAAPNTRIGGNLIYTAGKELIPAEGVVTGELRRIQPEAPPLFSAARIASRTWWFLAALLAGIAFIALFPLTTAMASQLARTSPGRCLLIGGLVSLALPLAALLSLSTLIGIPLGLLMLAAWGSMLYLGRIIIALVLGTAILRRGGNSIGRILAAMALGLALIYSATLFPAVGIPVQLAVAWLGTGALLLALLRKRRLIIQVPDELKHISELKKESNPEEVS